MEVKRERIADFEGCCFFGSKRERIVDYRTHHCLFGSKNREDAVFLEVKRERIADFWGCCFFRSKKRGCCIFGSKKREDR